MRSILRSVVRARTAATPLHAELQALRAAPALQLDDSVPSVARGLSTASKSWLASFAPQTTSALPLITPVLPIKREMSGFSYPAPRKLDAVVNLDLLQQEKPERISEIWVEYHASSASAVGKAVSRATYEAIHERATLCRFFVLPVQRDTGHFACLCQYQGNSWFVTFLDDFRRDPTSAQPYLCITVYPELAATKDVVLLRADVVALATLNKSDAALMLEQLVRFYGDEGLYQKHVYSFNKTPREFNVDAAYAAAGTIKAG